MSKSIVETVNARIDEIIAARAAEISSAEKALEAARAAVAEAQGRADTAVATTDVDGYESAVADMGKAERSTTLYNARLEQLRNKRNISAAEDASIMAQIRAYQKNLQDAATAEIVALLSRAEEIGKQYYADQDAVNELVWRWHSKVCPQQHPRGSGLTVYPSDLYAKDGDLRAAIHQIVTLYFYRKQLDVDQYHGMGSIWTK